MDNMFLKYAVGFMLGWLLRPLGDLVAKFTLNVYRNYKSEKQIIIEKGNNNENR